MVNKSKIKIRDIIKKVKDEAPEARPIRYWPSWASPPWTTTYLLSHPPPWTMAYLLSHPHPSWIME
jgi:hypothetical protein